MVIFYRKKKINICYIFIEFKIYEFIRCYFIYIIYFVEFIKDLFIEDDNIFFILFWVIFVN